MRKLSTFFSVLLLAFVVSACDTTEDELDDSEVFIGSWTVVEVRDEEGDKTAVFNEDIDSFSTEIEANGDFSLTVDYADQRPTIPLTGTYTIDEDLNALTLNGEIGGSAVPPLVFDYEIVSENEIELSIDDDWIEAVFGTEPATYVGEVTFTVERVD